MSIRRIDKRIAMACIIAIAGIFIVFVFYTKPTKTLTASVGDSETIASADGSDSATNVENSTQAAHESHSRMETQSQIKEAEKLWDEFDQSHRRKIAERVRQESIKRSHNKELQNVLTSVAQTVETIRWIRRGKHGELIVWPKNTSPSDTDLSLVKDRNSEDYLILGAGSNIGDVIFRVLSDGSIVDVTIENATTKSNERATMKWPMSPESGGIAFPTNGFIIAPNVTASGTSVQETNRECFGWLILDEEDCLLAPFELDRKPIANSIQILETGNNGFELHHTGPIENGLYATVDRTGIMVYKDSEADSQEYYWPYFYPDDGLAAPPAGMSVPYKLVDNVKMYLLEDGGLFGSGPPAVD